MMKFLDLFNFKSFVVVTLASGLYPLLHYYNGNLDLVGSKLQHFFLLSVSFLLPLGLIILSFFILKIKRFKKVEKYVLTAINLLVFFGLLSVLIFHFEKKPTFLILFISGLASLILYRFLSRIVIIQFLLAAMSFFTLIPKVVFAINHENDWAILEDNILETELKHTPNIYVIQPDGYVNIDEMKKPLYKFDNSKFNLWLENTGFVNYKKFRSNYYSTLTSNASMFAMKHHYYSNTYKGNLKTFHANKVIAGKENNTLSILKKNNYKTHLLVDNSYFLIDRIPLEFDYCNVPEDKILKYDSGYISGIDIVQDFENVLKNLKGDSNNFFFIEKTIPSHIYYRKSKSLGVEGEKQAYLDRVQIANLWLKDLIFNINKYDDNPMIVIVADHGSFVGLNYTLEAVNRRLKKDEIVSSFSSMLSIKWPKEIANNDLEFKTNVNLFRNIFSALSKDVTLLNFKEANNSYIPLKENGTANYYQCIDENYNLEYKLIKTDD